MVALFSTEKLKTANLDSLERLAIYSAQLLRSMIVKSDNSNLKDKTIAFGFREIKNDGLYIIVDAKIPYNSYIFNLYGGIIIDAIQELITDSPPSIDFICSSSIEPPLNLPKIPSFINTFEKLFMWSAAILKASSEVLNGVISIQPFDANPTNAFFQVNLQLKLDSGVWFLRGNVLNALLPYTNVYNLSFSPLIITSEITDSGNNNSSENITEIDDSTYLTDNILIADF